jgi:hypothetical protein
MLWQSFVKLGSRGYQTRAYRLREEKAIARRPTGFSQQMAWLNCADSAEAKLRLLIKDCMTTNDGAPGLTNDLGCSLNNVKYNRWLDVDRKRQQAQGSNDFATHCVYVRQGVIGCDAAERGWVVNDGSNKINRRDEANLV